MSSVVIIYTLFLYMTASCLAENIALDKPAYQIGSYGGATADKAVDGRYDRDTNDEYYLSVCAHPDTSWYGNGPAKWWVDLKATYSISNVTVWNTYNTGGYWRMNNFTAEVVTSDNKTTERCGDYRKQEPVSPGGSHTFNCNNKQGRYVYVRRLEGSKEQQLITLCEVQVYGYLVTTTTTTTTTTTKTIQRPTLTTTMVSPQTSKPASAPTESSLKTSSESSSSIPASSENKDEKNNTLIAVVITVTVVLMIAVMIILILLWQRNALKCMKSKKDMAYYMSHGENNKGFVKDTASVANVDNQSVILTEDELAAEEEETQITDTQNYNSEENPYINTLIPVSEFESYVTLKKSDEKDAFDEYKTLPQTDRSGYTIAITDDNKKKNRFMNVYPYDHTRVILNSEDPDTDGDYINGSFIEGYGNTEHAYIATQGPVHQTMRDFWRMIWQENANRIVMITNLSENGRKKCDRYWPEEINQTEKYEEFTVILESVAEYADYTIRLLNLSKQDEARSIYQYHFTSWKDKGRPSYGAVTLLKFHRKVHAKDEERTGPLVVHCSAGIGRTGTFIALDILLQQMAHERVVDILGCVQKLRHQRMQMVQTKEQFVFLHDAILEAINVGNTAFPCSTLAQDFDDICEEHGNQESEIKKQFKLLSKLKQREEEQYKEGSLEVNKDKNRDLAVIPGEHDRPYLTMRGEYHNLYINAVYVDSFKKHGYYIVTQMPLPNTQDDFWRLVYDHHLNAIVMLNELDQSDETCKQYWPDEGTSIYGPIKVKHMATAKITSSIIMREFMISLALNEHGREKPSHNVRHYQLLGWPNNEVFPPDKNALLSLIEEVRRWEQQNRHSKNTSEMGHIAIHCMNGVTRSGLFCGASHVVDEIELDEEVDALVAARYVSRRRHQFFETLDEFKFLYEIALKYISQSPSYANCS